LSGRIGRDFWRPCTRTKPYGIAWEILRYNTAEVTIELKAVVLARCSRPWRQTNTIAATVVRTGNSRPESIYEMNFERGVPFCVDIIISFAHEAGIAMNLRHAQMSKQPFRKSPIGK